MAHELFIGGLSFSTPREHLRERCIPAAVANGTRRLIEMNALDRAELNRAHRWNGQRRPR